MSDTTDKDFFGPEPLPDDPSEVIRVPLPRKDWRLILDTLNAAAGEKIAADEALQHPLILSVVKLSSSLIDAGQERTQAALLGAAFVTHEEHERVKALADRMAGLLQLSRDGYGGQEVDPNCGREDCEYLAPIDAALAAWKEARNG